MLMLTKDASSESKNTWLVVVGATMLMTSWLIMVAIHYPWTFNGDAYAAYYPTAKALLEGNGLTSFAHMWKGQARMPLFPALLALFSPFTSDLHQAAQVVNIICFAGMIFLVGLALSWIGWQHALVVVLVGLAANPAVSRLGCEALPGASCGLMLTATLVLVLRVWLTQSLKLMFWVGLLATGTLLARPNGLALLISLPLALLLCWPADRRTILARYGLGALVGLLPLAAISILLQLRDIYYPNVYVNLQNLPQGATSTGPGSILYSAAYGLYDLPRRMLAGLLNPVVLVISLSTFVYAAVRSKLKVPVRIMGIGLIGCLGFLAVIHHEDRFQVPFAPVLLASAGIGCIWLVQRIKWLRQQRLIATCLVGVAVAGVLLPGGYRQTRAWADNSQKKLARMTKICRKIDNLSTLPILVSIPGEHYSYNALRFCEQFNGFNTIVLPSQQPVSGPDLRFAVEAPEDMDTVFINTKSSQHEMFLLHNDKHVAHSSEYLDSSKPEVGRFPLPYANWGPKRCKIIHSKATPGLDLWISLQTPKDNGLNVAVTTSKTAQPARYTLATFGATQSYRLLASHDTPVDIELCPADPLKPGPDILWRLHTKN